jgi:hypothetical protein
MLIGNYSFSILQLRRRKLKANKTNKKGDTVFAIYVGLSMPEIPG